MRYILILALLAMIYLGLEPAVADCLTDTECARLCPANDRDCDGGPQS